MTEGQEFAVSSGAVPSVSVIIPTYNRSKTLGDAMASVLSQSVADLELIVVDDGSQEDVEPIVMGFGDPRVRFFRRSKNGGAGAARNSGLALAQGRFIAFHDSDDLWLPGKLARQMELLNSLGPAYGAVTAPKILYGRDENYVFGPGKSAVAPDPASKLMPGGDTVRHLFAENRVSLQNTLFRRDCYPGNVWFDPLARANEDWEFAVRFAQHADIHEDTVPVVLGFMSADSISRNKRRECTGLIRILKKNRAVLANYPRQHAGLRLDLARHMFKFGKRRLAMAFLASAVRLYPGIAASLVAMMGRWGKRRLSKTWQAVASPRRRQA
ncbi:MAG: glycosyltransferase family 2 protein [Devosia sp.]|uniref:glycosyltransferase family 2 protein n=1 Tax=unclassified Devosia TaxID=196773 RepID=UPI0019F19033|nr:MULTISPECIES: glycosyltransferase family A protein [unclassified Devosia]MBF0677737.1 glycosyltransferase family 2 protein [Devosia sp.]WEJ34208.1 glycosyltransferase family 2 protein [Devosia sp. SD17-2]